MINNSKKVAYPADVPKAKRSLYNSNWQLLTKKTGRLLLLAGDQRIEHLNSDFFGAGIDQADNDPEHFFQIADKAPIGAAAVHYGLASWYGQRYHRSAYIIKLNGKTNLLPGDPISRCLAGVGQAVTLAKQAGFRLAGVGYTIYLGSQHEGSMMAEAAEIIRQAHAQGLLAIIWIYPKGVNVKNEDSVETIAGAAGVAVSLGADFVKLKAPKPLTAKNIQRIVQAAGKTKVIFAGGSSRTAVQVFKDIQVQLTSGAGGVAIGRNIHQRSLVEASNWLRGLAAMIYEQKTAEQALKWLKTTQTSRRKIK